MLTSVDEVSSQATNATNQTQHQTIGTTVERQQMALNPTPELNHAPVEGESEETSPENAIHTVMFRYGKGGYYTKSDDSQARRDHYRKARIGSVATHFRTNDEFMWYQFQTLNKSTMHGNSKLKVVNPTVAQHATPDIIQQQRRAVHQMLNASDADYTKHLDVDDSFSATVGKHVVGGKAYWHECFLKLIGMAVEWGVPQFFATFTANEPGWEDLKRACGQGNFSDRPVEATRHYNHRWTAFNSTYLKIGSDTPLGKIKKTWYRQEDQVSGVRLGTW